MHPDTQPRPSRAKERSTHRRIAVAAVGVIFWFALSGLALNHATDFSLGDRPLPMGLVHIFYRADLPAVLAGQEIDGTWVTVVDGMLYHGMQRIAACRGGLRGTAATATLHAIACDDAVHLLTPTGEPFEIIDAAWGLPGRITAFGADIEAATGTNSSRFVIVTTAGTRCLDRDITALADCRAVPSINTTQRVPDAARTALARALGEQNVDVERFIHDLHSGRLFGTGARWLWDIFALALLALAGSGIVMLRRRG